MMIPVIIILLFTFCQRKM